MTIAELRQGAVTVLRPSGPLIQQDAAALREQLLRASSANLGRVVLDMSEIPFVDSAGLEAMLDVTEEMSQSGQTLRLCGANKNVREVMTLTDIAPLFDHFEDVTTAVRSFL
jgi:anti-sigma B factor antagonist